LFQIYGWPGNVREMENLVERLVILNEAGTITAADLPSKMRTKSSDAVAQAAVALTQGAINLPAMVAAFEDSLIAQAMRQAEGNKTRAAELLGLSRTTLIDRLKRPPDDQ
jgi:DNA-binding NtrC family response regulator